MKRLATICALSTCFLGLCVDSGIAQIIEIIDATGDKGGNTLDIAGRIATDVNGNVFVTGWLSNNVFKITPGGVITEIIDATGSGVPDTLVNPDRVATDANGNVFLTGTSTDNAFKITPAGVITEIIDAAGDGGANTLDRPSGVATDANGNVFVVGVGSDNVFKITPAGVITEIIDATGDGGANTFDNPIIVATDANGNVFVSGYLSDNVFRIATPGSCSTGGTPCTITEIIDAAGDTGGKILSGPHGVATDASGNVFVACETSDNAFKIATPGSCSTGGTSCAITEILDATGDGGGNTLNAAAGIATDANGNVFVTGAFSDNAFKIVTPGSCNTGGTSCTITEIIDANGSGVPDVLDQPIDIATDAKGNVFVTGLYSNNAFKIALSPPITADVKIFLEGAYQPGTDDMSTAINAILPLSQPYDSTLFNGTQLDYDGLESVGRMSTSMVDWVLVQLRKGDPIRPPMPVVAARAALLKSDGTIVDLNGTSAVSFAGLPAGNYYVTVFHRNHLGVITSSAVALSSSSAQYDFTTASSKAFGANPMKEVETGVWGLFAAEADVNGLNNAADFNLWLVDTKATATGYIQSDFNLDGQCTAADFNLWLVNTKLAAASRVP